MLKYYVFNPNISRKEEKQHENLLYYYPGDNVTLDEQLLDIGLGTTLSGLHRSFDPNSPLDSMCTDTYQMVYYEPEPDFWICISVPRRKTEEGTYAEDLGRPCLKAILMHAHRLYYFHHGKMAPFVPERVEDLRANLRSFYDVFVASIASTVPHGAMDIFDVLDGIRYLPVDNCSYLKMQSLVNQLENDFPSTIMNTVVVVDDLLMYTGLNLADTHTLYKFLTHRQRCNPKAPATDNTTSLSHPVPKDDSYVGFLTVAAGEGGRGIKQFVSEKVMGKKVKPEDIRPIPVHLGTLDMEDTAELLSSLVVFQHGKVLVSLLCHPEAIRHPPGKGVDPDFCRRVQAFMVEAVGPVLPSILDNITRSIVWDEAYHYIYFNRMNIALKTSLKRKGAESQEALRYIERMQQDFVNMPELKESWARSKESTWIVGRKSGSREFYAVFDGKPNLIDAHEEVKRVSQVFFNGIFVE